MFPYLILIILFVLYVLTEVYVMRYFFEKHFMVLSMDESGFEVMPASIFGKKTKTHILWTDVLGVYKVEGHDSAGWWYRMQKKVGSGLYWRLVVQTSNGNFVFHPSSTEGLNVARLTDKFDCSSQLEREFEKRDIKIEKADIQLMQAILGKKGWYKNR
jgi:hypothetical protein